MGPRRMGDTLGLKDPFAPSAPADALKAHCPPAGLVLHNCLHGLGGGTTVLGEVMCRNGHCPSKLSVPGESILSTLKPSGSMLIRAFAALVVLGI